MKAAVLPKPLAFRAWKAALPQEASTASGRHDLAISWLQAVGKKTFEVLPYPGDFESLGTELAVSFVEINHGRVGQSDHYHGATDVEAMTTDKQCDAS